jgi:hypothetical protein
MLAKPSLAVLLAEQPLPELQLGSVSVVLLQPLLVPWALATPAQ